MYTDIKIIFEMLIRVLVGRDILFSIVNIFNKKYENEFHHSICLLLMIFTNYLDFVYLIV